MKIIILYFFLLYALQVLANSQSSEEKEYKYPCGNKFYQYYLNDEPAEYGLSAGEYAKGKKAYVGLGNWLGFTFNTGIIQLKPPGITLNAAGGKGTFVNDTKSIFYLYRNRHHKYEWVDSQNSEIVPFAIDFGSESDGSPIYIGRIKRNDTLFIGPVAFFMGVMYYVNEKGFSVNTRTGYQVLTCRSCKLEKNIPLPKLPNANSVQGEIGCINNWIEYKGDDAPAKNGISAGSYDCGNTAYVGKGKPSYIIQPGRIQTVSKAGFYVMDGQKEKFVQNGSYYLADNPNYSYYWVNFDGTTPENAVYARQTVGAFAFPIARAKINGHVNIGKLIFPVAIFPNEPNGFDHYYNFEVLVCDPWPKYQCGQVWKKYAGDKAPSIDGFSIGTYKDDITSFIGRRTSKQINGCDYELGRIQIDPSNASGIYYLDELQAVGKFDNFNSEYLFKNPNDTYKWVASRSGVKIENALELHKEGHRPFYIGVTQINDNIFVGKVRPGEGMFYVDLNGNQLTTSSYNVLTCTSSNAANGIYKEESDEKWFGSFGCGARKKWDFKLWRCVCKDEFRDIFVSNGAKWSEDTCSYSL